MEWREARPLGLLAGNKAGKLSASGGKRIEKWMLMMRIIIQKVTNSIRGSIPEENNT